MSTNNGTTWTQTSLNNYSIYGLAVYGSHVIAGTYGAGVYVSTDNGTSWMPRNEGLGSNQFVRGLLIFQNYIFASPSSWVYRRPLGEVTGIEPVSNQTPDQYSLSQNYPNPFNPTTTISYQLPIQSHVTLKIYDLLGREISTLVSETKPPGSYEVTWNASGVSSGVYFYRLQAGDFVQARKFVLMK